MVAKSSVREDLSQLDIWKTMGADKMHLWVLREENVILRPLIFERPWWSGEVPDGWKKTNVTPIFKKEKMEDPRNDGPVSCTSVPGKIVGQTVLEAILWHVKDWKDDCEQPA